MGEESELNTEKKQRKERSSETSLWINNYGKSTIVLFLRNFSSYPQNKVVLLLNLIRQYFIPLKMRKLNKSANL